MRWGIRDWFDNIEFPDEEAEFRVPVSKLHDLLSRGRPVLFTDDDIEEDSETLESHGFPVDEHAVFPQQGVGRIIAIERQEIAGISVELFVIHFKSGDMTLRVPTEKYAAVGLRRLAGDLISRR